MVYNSTGLVVHDADAHIMETPNWLRDHADPSIRDRIEPLRYPGGNELQQSSDLHRTAPTTSTGPSHGWPSATVRATTPRSRRTRSCCARTSLPPDRSSPRIAAAPSICSASPASSCSTRSTTPGCATGSTPDDLELAIGAARAHNRGMIEFCAADPRLLSTLYVPLADLDQAPALAREAIEMGAAALLMASACPPGHSPSHIGLDPVWAIAEEARRADRVPRRRHRRVARPELLPQRAACPARFPRWRGELPVGRLHGDPRTSRHRRWRR